MKSLILTKPIKMNKLSTGFEKNNKMFSKINGFFEVE